MKRSLDRRSFLKLGLFAPGLPLSALAGQPPAGERRLSLYNLHTGEKVDLPYWIEGGYVAESLADISRVLHDHRTGEVAATESARHT